LAALLPAALFPLAGCAGDGGGSDAETAAAANSLLSPADLIETAPETFQARFETTKGEFVVEVTRAWAPNGADRFYNLVRNGFFDDVRFFRVMENFMAQFGMHGDPQVQASWTMATIPDDPVAASNTRGTLTFAMRGENTRTTQLFINFIDNSRLDAMGFAPIGTVIEGMDVVDQIYAGYGESASRGGNGPLAQNIAASGNEYLEESFPELDHIVSAEILP
jgi:peptidyl-prolyl cis-trans isomerase A (cyclophilin A)